jgi:hypothetical protein
METPDKIRKPKRVAKMASSARFGLNNNFIFFICLLIATFAWLLIKLSDTYTVTYNLNINYTELPVDQKITAIADSNVNISFTTNGFTLMNLELFSNMKQLQVQLKNYTLINEKDTYYKLNTQEIKKYLSEETQIPSDNIVFSKPFLGLEMEGLFAKKVKVKEDILFSFKEQYGLYGDIIVTPQKINVFGPKNILDTLQNILTQNIQLKEVENEQSLIIEMINPYPKLLSFEPKTVTVNFKVEKYTESSLEVPVEIGSKRNDITIFPKTVKVSFKVAQKDFNNVAPEFFTVSPETDGIDLNSVNKLNLKITKKPVYIRDERLTPSEVEFLIIK